MTHATTFMTHDQFAKSLIAHLDAGTQNPSHDIAARLRFARERALGAQKIAQPSLAFELASSPSGTLALGGGGNFNLFNKLGLIVPFILLVAGLLVISHIQSDYRAKEVADVDAAILTDDLPPDAYVDQGFGQFLKLQAER